MNGFVIVLVDDEVFVGVGEEEVVECLDDIALFGRIVSATVVGSEV